MENFIVSNSDTYGLKPGPGVVAGSWESDLLSDGAVAFFQTDGALIDATGSNFTDPMGMVYMARGRASGVQPIKTHMIDVRTLKVEKKAYNAPVPEMERIGYDGASTGSLNTPSPLVVGSIAGVIVQIVSRENPKFEDRRRYDYTLVTGDTVDTLTTALVALVNADADNHLLAATAGTGATRSITFTADSGEYYINIVPTGILENADRHQDGATGSTQGERGWGTAAMVLALENKFKANLGISDTRRKTPGMDAYVSQVNTSGTYLTYCLTWTNEAMVSQSFNKAGHKTMNAIICVPPAHTTLVSVLDAIFAAFLATV